MTISEFDLNTFVAMIGTDYFNNKVISYDGKEYTLDEAFRERPELFAKHIKYDPDTGIQGNVIELVDH